MTAFAQLRTTRKGAIGERIVKRYLTRKGWQVYTPDDGPHLVDFLAMRPNGKTIAVDVKTYPRQYVRNYTGIDKADYLKYITYAKENPVKLFFVDEVERMIYGADISDLEDVATESKGKVYFPLEAMTSVQTLSPTEVQQIRRVSSVDYSLYDRVPRWFVTST